jgi:hypothetical protein
MPLAGRLHPFPRKASAATLLIANQEGRAVAAVDLGSGGGPAHPARGRAYGGDCGYKRPSVYALTPQTGSVHEIQIDTLRLARKLAWASQAITMALSADEQSLLSWHASRERAGRGGTR